MKTPCYATRTQPTTAYVSGKLAEWRLLPVCRPAVLLQKLLTGLLEVEVRPQLRRVQRLPGQGILGLAAQMLDDGRALVGLAGFGL